MIEWYAPSEIKYNSNQVLFILKHLEMMLVGEWPPECRETGYTGGGSYHSHSAKFEVPVVIAAEVSQRLEKCGLSGRLLTAQVKAELPLDFDSRLALWYCSGWRRKQMSFNDWRNQWVMRHQLNAFNSHLTKI